jgi:hypothetical protein
MARSALNRFFRRRNKTLSEEAVMIAELKADVLKEINKRFDELIAVYTQYNANVAISEELILRMQEAQKALWADPYVRPKDPAYR